MVGSHLVHCSVVPELVGLVRFKLTIDAQACRIVLLRADAAAMLFEVNHSSLCDGFCRAI